MLVFYESLSEKTNCRDTTVFQSCFSTFMVNNKDRELVSCKILNTFS